MQKDAVRAAQRQKIYKDFLPEEAIYLRKLFPSQDDMNFTSSIVGKDNRLANTIYSDDMRNFRNWAGGRTGAYQIIFELATTAENPRHLQNILGALSIMEESSYDTTRTMISANQERSTFLQQTREPKGVSDQAKAVQQQLVHYFDSQNGGFYNAEELVDVIAGTFFRQGIVFYEKNRRYLAEAYVYTVLNPTTPLELREALLKRAVQFDFRTAAKSHELQPKIVSEDSSFWDNVDGSWVDGRLDIEGKLMPDTEAIAALQERIFSLEQQLAEEKSGRAGDAFRSDRRIALLQRSNAILKGNNEWLTNELVLERQRRGKLGFGDHIDQFLAMVGLTRDELKDLHKRDAQAGKRKAEQLIKVASILFHPNGGVSANEPVLKQINGFLDTFKR